MVNKEGFPTKKGQRSLLRKDRLVRLKSVKGTEGSAAPYTEKKNEVIVNEYDTGKVFRFNIETKEVLWETKLASGACLGDYHPNHGVVVGTRHGKITVLDGADGTVTETHRATGLGKWFGTPFVCEWFLGDYRKIFVSDRGRHIAGLYDLDTETFDQYFGVQDTKGSDLTHLRNPRGVNYIVDDNRNVTKMLVADTDNHRVLQIDWATNSVEQVWLMRSPMACDPLRCDFPNYEYGVEDPKYNAVLAIGSKSYDSQGLVPIIQSGGSRLFGFAPIPNLDRAFLNPRNPNKFATGLGQYWAEIRLEDTLKNTPRPFSLSLLDGKTISANSDYPTSSYPQATLLNGWGFERIQLFIYTSQTATLHIDVPDTLTGSPASLWVPTDYSWVEYDSRSLSAGAMNQYTFTDPPPIFRPRISMGGTEGTVNVYAKGQ